MKVLLTGASGFVGQRLGLALVQAGHQVVAVGRDPSRMKLEFSAEKRDWDSLQGAMLGIDAIINLAGEPVAQSWNPETKRRILSSRVDSARRLREALQSSPGSRPLVLLSASGIGFYGDQGDKILQESLLPGEDFLAKVCVEWEKAALAMQPLVARVAVFRIGMVLGKGGGALAKMLPPFRLGLGGRLGSGEQWVSWIQLEDLVQLFLFALDNPGVKGVFNAVAPAPVKNIDFTRELAAAVKRPAVLPAPAFALKLALGEMSSMLLGGQRASPQKIQDAGFRFRYPALGDALRASISG